MLNILLIDDEPDLLEIYQETLREYITANFTTASNGKEALDLTQQQSFDIIISDINMPRMSGLELLKVLRENSVFTPFILITGYGDVEKIRTAWQFGAADFIDKPVNEKQFGTSVQNVASTLGTQLTNKAWLGQEKAFSRFDLFLDADKFKKLKSYCDQNLISIHTAITKMIDEKFS